jgi:hypothetical protein
MNSSDAIRECYNIEDTSQAMSCIKREIKEATGGCKPRMVLLTKEGCAGCKESKKAYEGDIAAGIVKAIDIRTPEGARLAKLNGIDTVPSFLILDCQDNAIV